MIARVFCQIRPRFTPHLYSLLNGILLTSITIPSSLNEYQTFYKGIKTLGLKVLKIEAVCSIGVVAANADCETGNELKNYY